ncbi:carbohydrate ABC transporter membrane protein 1 (CUT1 family) [Kribbella voronezhensis]|uniref:Carbohydrate ABC transporter membrane protein 1 (CUT1 family) n=1 Tax=Kribbella voronezhensis TaxID=2512212 RepID=A0A4R7SV20_9ACTN|nr:sugar ABC transporter permease [Kribbella voronezhensis]TDU82416.1 carbohydrate ABC transporter membrane protein 1 (CUT1 family) [Kribbella voronezhensis]
MTTVTQRPPDTEPEPTHRAARAKSTLRGQENRAGLVLVSPTFVIVLVVVVLPILWTIVLAFQNVRLVDIQSQGLFGHWTLHNLQRVFSSPGFWSSLWTTVVYTVGSTLGSIVVGLVAALALRKPFRGRALVRGAMLLPYVAPVVAVAFVWQVLLSPDLGVVNHWGMNVFGWDRPIAFLTQRSYDVAGVPVPMALFTVIAFETWRYFPFAFLFLLARLQAVPAVLEEAAVVDGTTPWQRFRFILLPQLLPVIALLTVLRFIMTFNKFDDVYLLTGGGAGTDVVAVRVYRFLTARFDVGLASAQAVVLAVVLIVLLGLYFKFFGRRVQEEQS